MMLNLKKTIKLLGYGLQLKANLITGALIGFAGLVIICAITFFPPADSFAARSGNVMLVSGMTLLILGFMMPSQVFISLECCGLVLSSKMRRWVGVYIQDAIICAASVLSLLILLLLKLIQGDWGDLGKYIFCYGMCVFMLASYMPIGYRNLILGMVIYMFGFLGDTMVAIVYFPFDPDRSSALLGGMGIGLGVLFAVVGLLLSALLRRFLYKRPVAKLVMPKELRKGL